MIPHPTFWHATASLLARIRQGSTSRVDARVAKEHPVKRFDRVRGTRSSSRLSRRSALRGLGLATAALAGRHSLATTDSIRASSRSMVTVAQTAVADGLLGVLDKYVASAPSIPGMVFAISNPAQA